MKHTEEHSHQPQEHEDQLVKAMKHTEEHISLRNMKTSCFRYIRRWRIWWTSQPDMFDMIATKVEFVGHVREQLSCCALACGTACGE